MANAKPVKCPFCSSTHMPRFLCDEAKAVLDGVVAKAAANDVPTMEFAEPIWRTADGEDILLTQMTVAGAMIPVGDDDAVFPALVFSGRDQHDRPLPRWLYVGNCDQIVYMRDLVAKQANGAVRMVLAAQAGRGEDS